jgi:hypothetical protein
LLVDQGSIEESMGGSDTLWRGEPSVTLVPKAFIPPLLLAAAEKMPVSFGEKPLVWKPEELRPFVANPLMLFQRDDQIDHLRVFGEATLAKSWICR